MTIKWLIFLTYLLLMIIITEEEFDNYILHIDPERYDYYGYVLGEFNNTEILNH